MRQPLSEKGANLLRQVAAKLREHPEQHNQNSWCGTACCVAGHIVLEAGWVHTARADGAIAAACHRPGLPDAWLPVSIVALDELGIEDFDDAEEFGEYVFDSQATPIGGLTWPEALEELADGMDPEAVLGIHYQTDDDL